MTGSEAKDWFSTRVSRETIDRLEIFHDLIVRWQRTINLIAPSTLNILWTRHFVDSAQLFFLVDTGIRSWLDIGSGAGFPGLVIACLAAEKNERLLVSLVESDTRKCSFMQEAARQMGLNVKIYPERIDAVPPQSAEVISARALSTLSALLDHARPHMHSRSVLLFPKGSTFQDELDTLDPEWQRAVEVVRSVTDPDSVILRICRS